MLYFSLLNFTFIVRLFIPSFLTQFATNVFAQNVGIGTTTPSTSSLLHLSSTNKGMLIPQINIDSLKDVTSIPTPADGLIIFNTVQPGAKNDMARGYYYYNTTALTWVSMSDNFNDNQWQPGGVLVTQLRDKTGGVEFMDDYQGIQTVFAPKLKILRSLDSASLNSKNNINVLVLSGTERKTTAGCDTRQKSTIVFENNYVLANGTTSATSNNVAISGYTENTGTAQNTQTNGLGFYVFAPPQNAAVSDTPSMTLYRHNASIGTYATDANSVSDGRLKVTGYTNGDQLSLRHPFSVALKWGFYVSWMDSSLNFYSNGALRSNIDRVSGVYTALSDRNWKKNIKPLPPILETLIRLPVYSFHYKDDIASNRWMLGFMAQEVKPYFPELVYQRYDREITNPVLTIDYSGLGVIAIKAIQEQQTIIQRQQEMLDKQ